MSFQSPAGARQRKTQTENPSTKRLKPVAITKANAVKTAAGSQMPGRRELCHIVTTIVPASFPAEGEPGWPLWG